MPVSGTGPGPRVLGMGNACLDTVLELEAWPPAGEKAALRGPALYSTGGQVAGAMVGCVRLGLAARMLLRTGDDAAGARIRGDLASAGVDLSFARIVAGATSAMATIGVDRKGERTVLWHTPAAMAVEAAEITPAMLEETSVVFFDGRDGPACMRAARLARERGIPVAADVDCLYPHSPALLAWVDHLVVPGALAEEVRRMAAPHATVVATRGAGGAIGWEAGGQGRESPAFPVTVVDSTGAGDAFHAGYLYGMVQGWPLAEKMRFANACGAWACTAWGALAALPRRQQVETLLESVAR